MVSLLPLFLALFGGAAPPAAASASSVLGVPVHAQLERSSPADGDTLSVAPQRVVLTFSGLVEETGAVLTLLGPDGHSWTLEPNRSGVDPRELSAAFPSLPSGGFRLEWRVISLDGHPVSGDVVFFVSGIGAGSAALEPPPPSRPMLGGGSGPMDMTASGGAHMASPLTMGVRGGLDLALLGLAGLLLFTSLPGAGVNGRTLSVARLLVVLAALGTLAYGWLWAGGVLEAAPTAQDRVDALVSLVSGRPLVAEIVLAWLALWALLLARRPGLAALFAMAAVVVGGWGGHPTSYVAVISAPANALHLAGVAVWTGGLLLLVTEAGSSNFPASARRVSDFALVAGGVVAVTGLVQSWIFIDSLRQLTQSTYGLLVLAKVGGLVILVAFGAYHRFRLVPQLDLDPSGRGLSGSVRRELTVAVGVILVGAILSHIPPNP